MKTALLQFKIDQKFSKRDSEKLRGYFGNLYKEEDLFHNHGNTGVIYRYPLIQYRVIDGVLSILGYNEGVTTLGDKFLKTDYIKIGLDEYRHFETSFSVKDFDLAVTDQLIEYQFESFWLPVNQKNYLDYINQKLDLNRILQNHILSAMKGLGVTAESKIMVNGNFIPRNVKLNDQEFFAFSGSFIANVEIPDHLGLGQKTAFGFGSVVRRGE